MSIHQKVLDKWDMIEAMSYIELLTLANQIGIGRDTTYRWTSKKQALKVIREHCEIWAKERSK